MRGSASSARAKAMSCRWPSESREAALAELGLVAVLELRSMKSSRADGARGRDDLLAASPPGGRRRCSRATVPAKRKPSCGTIAELAAERLLRHVAEVEAVDRDPALASGRRSARSASRSSTCRRRCGRRARRSSRPARRGRCRAAPPAPRRRSRSGRSRSATRPVDRGRASPRVGRVAHLGLLVEHVHDLVERGDGGEERVVELRELLHRVEEVRQVERGTRGACRPSVVPSKTR